MHLYMWTLIGHDTSEPEIFSGMNGDLSALMRTIEPLLLQGRGFVARVAEVVPRMSVSHLGEVHVPTGREWLARRNDRGGVHWQQRCHPIDPSAVYSLAACDLKTLAG
jgi:hypothetical protein